MLKRLTKVFIFICLLAVPSTIFAAENNIGGKSLEAINSKGEVVSFDKSVLSSFGDDKTYKQSLNDLVTPRVVIGTDQRTMVTTLTVTPYKSIVHFDMGQFSDGSTGTYCSGTLIGSNKVLTAAHCVFNHDAGKISMVSGVVYPGRGLGATPYGSANVVDYYFPAAYKTQANFIYDYAVLILDRNIGDVTGYLNIKSSPTVSTSTNIGIYGYPGDLINQNGRYDQYGMRGYPTSQTSQLLYYQLDTAGGQSGSAILNSSNEVLGVHVGGSSTRNIGVKFYNEPYTFITNILNNY